MLEDRSCLLSREYPRSCESSSNWRMNYRLEIHQSKRPLETNGEEEEDLVRKVSKIDTSLSIGGILVSLSDQSSSQEHASDNSDSSSLIAAIGRDNSISCLIRCSRADYGALASLNWSFRMNKPRKMCSSVFMDRKFYVIGGIGGANSELLTSGEEYDLETETWTEILNMSPVRTGAARDNNTPAASEAPPLIAVVNNELYAADYADMEVRKYNKNNGGGWITVGRLPERADSMYGWGLAFRACGNRLIVIGGPRNTCEGFIEVNSWVPSDGPPQWEMLARKRSGSFVYNCAVMGC
ncbi:hypothetical protein BUALT_Bualt17G0068100 [Buddleja alternifolia]|uniref:F-box/kelch-repeat protein SKIP11 n=1 Tax=Buddleja alternifolia TaxID=168488 RepID=A0AAV6WH79_9LAMI|nr:hypothetical protein BUALT_Bualt17G0068100 [Buddleja alternifolia]